MVSEDDVAGAVVWRPGRVGTSRGIEQVVDRRSTGHPPLGLRIQGQPIRLYAREAPAVAEIDARRSAPESGAA